MKTIVRLLLINGISLYLAAYLIPGISYSGGYKTLFEAAVILGLINFFISPVFKILLLPINLLTFEVFGWLVNVFIFYLLILLIPEFKLMPWNFSGTEIQGFSLPSFQVNVFFTALLGAVIIRISGRVLHWLLG